MRNLRKFASQFDLGLTFSRLSGLVTWLAESVSGEFLASDIQSYLKTSHSDAHSMLVLLEEWGFLASIGRRTILTSRGRDFARLSAAKKQIFVKRWLLEFDELDEAMGALRKSASHSISRTALWRALGFMGLQPSPFRVQHWAEGFIRFIQDCGLIVYDRASNSFFLPKHSSGPSDSNEFSGLKSNLIMNAQ